MDNNPCNDMDAPVKKRGRPRKYEPVADNTPKRPRGRPRKYPVRTDIRVQRKRGRPRKYTVAEREVLVTKDRTHSLQAPVVRKVDTGYLIKHLMQYFTKLLLIHHRIQQSGLGGEALGKRLKSIDLQMIDICKEVLGEFAVPSDEDKMAS